MIEIEEENICPIEKGKKWLVNNTKKKCIYKIRDILPGEIFGHEELIDHFMDVRKTGDFTKPVPRRKHRIFACETTDIFFVNVGKFYNFFNDLDLEKLLKHCVKIDKNEI